MTDQLRDPLVDITTAAQLIELGEFSEANKLLLPLLAAVNAEAEYLSANIGTSDESGEHFNLRRLKLLESAAKKSHANANYDLWVMFDAGDGVATDRKRAHEYLERAAELEHPNAVWQMAIMLIYGTGPRGRLDLTEGKLQLEKAVQLKSQGAMWTLAGFHRTGEFGFEVDISKSERYLALSEADGVVWV